MAGIHVIKTIRISYQKLKKTTLFEPEHITKILEEHGDTIQLQFLARHLYLFAHPAFINYIFDRPDIYLRSKQAIGNTDEVFGKEGLVTIQDYAIWKNDRTNIGELFQTELMKEYTTIMVKTIKEQFKQWQQFAEKKQLIRIDQYFNTMTAHNVVNTLFQGVKTDPELISITGRELAYLTLPFYYFTKAKLFGIFPMPRYYKDKQILNALADDVLKQSLKESTPNMNLIKHLAKIYNCQLYDQLTPHLKKHLHSEVLTFLIAGHETTAALMGYITIFLASYPDIAAKVYDEVQTILGGRDPEYDNLEKLIYTRAVIKETLRLRPPARVIIRVPIKNDIIGGYTIKKNDIIYIPIFSLHRLSKYWEYEPEKFYPDRFLQPLSNYQKTLYMPFGRGERNCIGSQFATMEATIILALLTQRFRFSIPPDFKLTREPAMFDRLANNTEIFIENLN